MVLWSAVGSCGRRWRAIFKVRRSRWTAALRRDSSEPRPTLPSLLTLPRKWGRAGGEGRVEACGGEEEDENHRTERTRPCRCDRNRGDDGGGARNGPTAHRGGSAGDAAGAGLQCCRPAIVRPIGGLARQYRVFALLGRHGDVDADIRCAWRYGLR